VAAPLGRFALSEEEQACVVPSHGSWSAPLEE
jgi:hypothetical protein